MCVPCGLVMAANRCRPDHRSDSSIRVQASEVAASIKVKTLTLALRVEVGLHVTPLLLQSLLAISHGFLGLLCITDEQDVTAQSS